MATEATVKNSARDGLSRRSGHRGADVPTASLKMIDILINSFTCDAVSGLL